MATVFGYMITWTTYGSWLQGDERGYVKDGQQLNANPGLERANREMMLRDAISLRQADREVAKKAILAEAERIGEKILAISVGSRHVHVVVAGGGKPIGKVVSRLKCAAYYEIHKNGAGKRLWTRGYDKRLCFDEESLATRIRYVEEHLR